MRTRGRTRRGGLQPSRERVTLVRLEYGLQSREQFGLFPAMLWKKLHQTLLQDLERDAWGVRVAPQPLDEQPDGRFESTRQQHGIAYSSTTAGKAARSQGSDRHLHADQVLTQASERCIAGEVEIPSARRCALVHLLKRGRDAFVRRIDDRREGWESHGLRLRNPGRSRSEVQPIERSPAGACPDLRSQSLDASDGYPPDRQAA